MNILLIGIGGYGKHYVETLLALEFESARLVAVVDPFIDQSPYKNMLLEHSVKLFNSSEACYTSGLAIDLVMICSPIHTHYDYIVEALDHCCNVLCEKPVTLEPTLFEDLLVRQEKSGCFVAVGFQHCFSLALHALKRDILDGVYGRPLRMKSLILTRREDHYYTRNNWAGALRAGNEHIYDSPLSNGCSHQLQVMLYLLGPSIDESVQVRKVTGHTLQGRPTIENYDGLAIRIETERDVPLFFAAAHCIRTKCIGPLYEFEFEKAAITLEGSVWKATFRDGSIKEYSFDQENPMQKVHAVIQNAKEHTLPLCTLKSVKSHLKVVLMAQQLQSAAYPLAVRYEMDGVSFWAIDNLETSMMQAYAEWALPTVM